MKITLPSSSSFVCSNCVKLLLSFLICYKISESQKLFRGHYRSTKTTTSAPPRTPLLWSDPFPRWQNSLSLVPRMEQKHRSPQRQQSPSSFPFSIKVGAEGSTSYYPAEKYSLKDKFPWDIFVQDFSSPSTFNRRQDKQISATDSSTTSTTTTTVTTTTSVSATTPTTSAFTPPFVMSPMDQTTPEEQQQQQPVIGGCYQRVCDQDIIRRRVPFRRALEILQLEEYLNEIGDIVVASRKKRDTAESRLESRLFHSSPVSLTNESPGAAAATSVALSSVAALLALIYTARKDQFAAAAAYPFRDRRRPKSSVPTMVSDLVRHAISLIPAGHRTVAVFPPFQTPRTFDAAAVIFSEELEVETERGERRRRWRPRGRGRGRRTFISK